MASAPLPAIGRSPVLLRYLLASLAALAMDYATFATLLRLAIPAVPAAVAGYASGICIHWLASSRTVFNTSVARSPAARARQKLLFAGSALAGIAITSGVVAMGVHAGADPRLAKLVAVGASFTTTWLLRRHVVFA